MLTIKKLKAGTKKLRKTPPSVVLAADIKLLGPKVNANAGTVEYQGRVRGTTEGGTHKPVVKFFKMVVGDKKSKATPISFTSKRTGNVVSFSRASLAQSPVEVGCTCSDYYFTWYPWVKAKDSHFGPDLPAYESKGSGRPPRNPLQVPGACKHIMGLVDALVAKKYVEE